MSQERLESPDAALAKKLYNFSVRDQNNKEVGRDKKLDLKAANRLTLTLEFREAPTSHLIRVCVVINKRGDDLNGASGSYKPASIATTFVHIAEVLRDPPRLEFSILHRQSEKPEIRWHDGAGPYDTTIALTPMDVNGEPDETATSALSYEFTGVE